MAEETEKQIEEILSALKKSADKEFIKQIEYFGVDATHALGVKVPVLRELAKKYKKNQPLADALWQQQYHEAKHLAIFLTEPKTFTSKKLDDWVMEIYSWDLCDNFCGSVAVHTPFAFDKVTQWIKRKDEYVKRAGFVIMAMISIHQKKIPDDALLPFFNLLENNTDDNRNFVKKAVNWSLRQLGKRSKFLHEKAKECATRIALQKHSSAKWIASDALREFNSEKALSILEKRAQTKAKKSLQTKA